MVGLRREGEDVGAGAAQDQGDLRQPAEVESAKVIQDGTGSLQPDIPGMCTKLEPVTCCKVQQGELSENS